MIHTAFPQHPICPYCHSAHTQLIEQHELAMTQHAPSLASFSPMTLATVGMHLSKRLYLPPLLGGLAGLVMGGMLLLYINYQKPIQVLHYQCEQCHDHFEVQHTT